MLHIYRQITGLRRLHPIVIAQKRENADLFPFDTIDIIAKPSLHFLRRFWFRQIRNKPWQISATELRSLIEVLNRRNAQLLHIFFGHIAVHLLPLIRAWSKPSIVSFHGADVLVDMEKPAYRNATLTIAGEGPMLRELEELTCKLKIDDRVALPGFVTPKKLREIYYASHIFLHPSETGSDGNQEGIPNSMLEAMATGLPVFATDHGGIPEAIENSVSGVLVPESDYEALSHALLEAVQDRHLLGRLARNGATVVAQKFDQRNQIRRLEEIYLGMIGRSGSPEPPANASPAR